MASRTNGRVRPSLGLIGLLLVLNTISAQQNPPAAYAGSVKVSYVRTWDAVKPTTDTTGLTLTADPTSSRMTSQYFDGFGRPIQTVVKKGSLVTTTGTFIDQVSAATYDELGRESYNYLPFAANNTGGNASISDGLFKLNPFQQQAAFYASSNTNGPLYGQNQTYFYGNTKLEASPLNRPLETYAPGNSWAGTSGQTSEDNRRAVKMKYWLNTSTDSVRKWIVTNVANGWGVYSTPGTFASCQLVKTIIVDEHGKQVVEYKDKQGKVLLKKVQFTAAADTGTGKGYNGWLATYYVYDSLNNLRCVIQPEGVKALAANGWSLNTTLLDEQCFRYEYDYRNRMIRKKVPGA
ncbi:MAG: hypothetical protein B7Z54_06385, partial [Sphingobacteriales bacterium 12-47-4]